MNWGEFFHMGGYAAFVWPAYLLALSVLVINIVSPVIQYRQVRAQLDKQQRAATAASSSQQRSSA